MELPSQTSAARVFVGRESELTELDAGVARALLGRGQLYLVAGEPGIGKTRLADELCERGVARGAQVIWGRCWESGGAPAYWPWLDVIAAAGEQLSDAALLSALGDGAAAVAQLVPALRARLPELPGAVGGSPQQARFALFRAVSGMLRRAASERALLVVLDDLHAADEPSILLLHFIAHELRAMRVFVLGTYRDVEARLSVEVGEALGRLTREGSTLALARLDLEHTAKLLQQRAGVHDPAVQGEIFRRTQGNPLFLEELARLIGQGDAGAARGALPAGVRDVIRQRLARLPGDARALLEVAAVLGDEFDPAQVAHSCAEPAPAVARAFETAVALGVLVARARQRFRFSHALVREVLQSDLPLTRKQALHAQVAAALLSRAQAGDGPTPHAELAHHYLEGPPDGLGQAALHAIQAAERSLATFAFEDAVALLERVLDAVEQGAGPSRMRAQVLIALGRAQIRRGRGEVGRALCGQAFELGRALCDAELVAGAALAYGLEITAALVDPVLVARLQAALALLPEADSALRVQVTARLGAAMQPAADMNQPIALAQTAISAARRLGRADTLLDAIFTGMAAMMDVTDPRTRLPLNLEVEQLASAAHDSEKLLRTHVRLVFDHMELGELDAADARIDQFERMAQQTGALRYAWRVPLFRSMRALMHGRFEQAERHVQQARELGEQAQDPQLERCYVFHREGLLRAWERHDDMLAYDVEARRLRAALYSGPHWQNGGSAFTHARVEAVEQAQMYLGLVPQDDWPRVQNPPAFMHLAEPLASFGGRALVERMYQQLLPGSHRCISWGWTMFIWDGPAQRILGLLAARLCDHAQASRHFERAIEQLETMGAAPYLARTRYEYGRALAERESRAQRLQARALIEQAYTAARALDLRGLARLAERRLHLLEGSSATPEASASHAAGAAVPAPAAHIEREGVSTQTSAALDPARPGRAGPAQQASADAELLAGQGASPPATSARPELGAPVVSPAPDAGSSQAGPLPFALTAEGEYWKVRYRDQAFHLRDSLGLQYLARLIAEPGRALHVLELSGGTAAGPLTEQADGGDAGELLDETAVASYRARLTDLRETLIEAEELGDSGRAERTREELEFLSAELSRAVGLGGRRRRAGGATERARSAVQRRIRSAIERIREHSPKLAVLLDRSIKTGAFCAFRHEDGEP